METFTDKKSYGIFSNAANRKIIKNLEDSGAKVFLFPVIETEAIKTQENLDFIEQNLAEIEWLIFPDVFAVDYFLEILNECEIDLFELDEKRVLTFGEAIADRLRFSQTHSDIISNSIGSDDIFRTFQEFIQTELLKGVKILLPIFKGFENELVRKLKNIGAKVFELEIFSVKFPIDNQASKLKALLTGGAIDDFIFTAPEDIFFLTQMLFPSTINEVLKELQCFGTNEITMQTLHENGIVSKYFQTK